MTLFQNFSDTLWFPVILLWSLIWKGIALWKAGRHNQPYWFVALLVINTAGLLEIVYLLWFQKDRSITKGIRTKLNS